VGNINLLREGKVQRVYEY